MADWFSANAPGWFDSHHPVQSIANRVLGAAQGVTVAQDRYTRTPIVWDENHPNPDIEGYYSPSQSLGALDLRTGYTGIDPAQRGVIVLPGGKPGKDPETLRHEIVHAATSGPLRDPAIRAKVDAAIPQKFASYIKDRWAQPSTPGVRSIGTPTNNTVNEATAEIFSNPKLSTPSYRRMLADQFPGEKTRQTLYSLGALQADPQPEAELQPVIAYSMKTAQKVKPRVPTATKAPGQ